MEKQWFVIHTLTGKEMKVRDSLLRRIKTEEMSDLVGDVSIPSEKISEVKKGKKSTTTRMFYPGYVLIQIGLYKEDGKINERVWYYVNDTPGVIGFIADAVQGTYRWILWYKPIDDVATVTVI